MKILLLNGSGYGRALRELGHDVSEFGPGAREYSLNAALEHAGFEPDLILTMLFGPIRFLRGLESCSYPLAAHVYDSSFNHFWLRHYARLFDRVFVDFQSSVRELAREGIAAHWLPYAIDPADFPAFPDAAAQFDVGFVGVTERRARRCALLRSLSREFRVGVAGGIAPDDRLDLPQMAEFFSRCRIVINEYLYDGVNFRVFEALASGSFLLTEHTENGLTALFEPGVHLGTYTPATLHERVRHHLRDSAARRAIARAGREHVLRHHTLRRRARELLAVATPICGRRMERDAGARSLTSAEGIHAFCQRWPQRAPDELPWARSCLETASRANPRDGRTDWLLGRIHAESRQPRRAVERLRRAASRLAHEPRVWFHLGHQLHFMDEPALALRSFELGLGRCRASPAVLATARTRLREGQLDAQLWCALGNALHAEGLAPGLNALGATGFPFPMSPHEYLLRAFIEAPSAETLVCLGVVFEQSGESMFALDMYEDALGRGVRDPSVLFAAGALLVRSFSRERGLRLIREALQTRPALRERLKPLELRPDEWSALVPVRRPSGTSAGSRARADLPA